MAKQLLVPFFLLAAFLPGANAQSSAIKVGKNVFYAEWYGNAVYYSLNYERTLKRRSPHLTCVRAGAMTYPCVYTKGGWIFAFPVELNFLYGKRIKKFELGIGNTFTTGNFYHMANTPKRGYCKDYYQLFILTGRAGYRIYSQSGFVFRGGVLPMMVYKPGYVRENSDTETFGFARKNPKTFDFAVSLGLSFGYSF